MTLPYSEEEPRTLTNEEKGKAVLKLVGTVFTIDAMAIVVYLILVLVLGWDEMTPLLPLIVITIITGMYFQWKLKKINN